MFSIEVDLKETRKYSSLYGMHLQHMTNTIDDGINACDDFFEHACGNYDSNQDSVPPFLYNQEDRMQFFEEHKHQFGSHVGILLHNLYMSCKARKEINVFTPQPRKSQWMLMLEQIQCLNERQVAYSQYPFLQHEWEILQPQYNLSWLNLSAKLAAHGLPTLINIYFAEQVAFVTTALNINTCPSRLNFIEILLPFLKATQRNIQIAHIIGNELWQFCQELSGEVELSILQQHNDDDDDDDTDILSTKFANEYLNAYFAYLNFTEAELTTAQKMPLHVEHLKRIFNILQMTEPRIILNYILWQTYEQLRFDDCYQLTQEFEHLLLTEYWSWHVFEAYFSRHVALAHYMFQTTRFQQMRKTKLLSEHWLQYLVRPPRYKHLNLQLLITDYAQTHLNAEQFDADYEQIYAEMNDEFYRQLLQMRQVELRRTYYLPLIARDIDENEGLYFLRKFIHFSILLIKQPLYHYYATEGFDLWLKSNLFYSSDGYLTALDCLLQQQQQVVVEKDKEIDNSNISEEQVLNIYRFYNTFLQCQNDYDFWLQAESFAFAEDYVLEYYNLTTHSILYYAITQLYCGRYDVVYSAIINRTFMNMEHFSYVFNCTTTTTTTTTNMNPSVKCMMGN